MRGAGNPVSDPVLSVDRCGQPWALSDELSYQPSRGLHLRGLCWIDEKGSYLVEDRHNVGSVACGFRLKHLHDMGERFCAIAKQSDQMNDRLRDEHVFQNLHWGLELLLRAFLQTRGWTDERCMVEIKHDLRAGLEVCESEGLEGSKQRARSLLAALSPYSRCHRVAEFVAAGAGGWTAKEAIAASAELEDALHRAAGLSSGGAYLEALL